ncbi:MAG: hypothetical protein OD811_04640 [Alphaproteobacteria bacterium]
MRAIKSDTKAQHHAIWQEKGHDDLADIVVTIDGTTTYPIQIKSGVITKDGMLQLSGQRLGRFDANFAMITRYLNANRANIVSIPYRQTDDEHGRKHIYRVCYIDIQHLTGLSTRRWKRHGKQHHQINDAGVHFSLRPSLSWQIWWKIPEDLLFCGKEFKIG